MSSPFPFELTDQCVKCGLCLPHCPTYQLSQSEGESPRGRIAIIEGLERGTLQPSAHSTALIDHCLSCGRCESVCPAKVRYQEMRDTHLARRPAGPKRRRIALLSRAPRLLELMTLRIMQRVLRVLPARWLGQRLDRLSRPLRHARLATTPWPPLATALPSEVAAPSSASSAAPAQLFLGCVATALESAAQQRIAALLAQLEVPVQPSPTRGCCGALAQHAGDVTQARRQRQVWANHHSPLVSCDSGCHADLARSGAQVWESCHYLHTHWPPHWVLRAPTQPLRVALHVPCTHHAADTPVYAVTDVLRRIPGIDIHPLTGLGCCGASGMHMVDDPAHARTFARALLEDIPDAVDTVVSTNVGCRLHLRDVAASSGRTLIVCHPLELIADALSDTLPR